MKEKLERIVEFKAAFDRRNKDPKKDYGIHSVQCYMILRGEKGAVHFTFSTGMLLPKTVEEYIKTGRAKYEITSYGHYYLNKPMGYDVGYHAYEPQYEGQEVLWPTKSVYPKGGIDWKNQKKASKQVLKIKYRKIGKKPPNCQWIGVPCYCDGSAMRAETYLDVLVNEGSDKIWEMLEGEYKRLVLSSKDAKRSAAKKPDSSTRPTRRRNR